MICFEGYVSINFFCCDLLCVLEPKLGANAALIRRGRVVRGCGESLFAVHVPNFFPPNLCTADQLFSKNDTYCFLDW